MFRKIVRELVGLREGLDAVSEGVRRLSDAHGMPGGAGVDADRLAALEGRMEVVLGAVEAGITKAEALKSTALAAEDRARGKMKRAEVLLETQQQLELARGDPEGEEEDSFEAIGRSFAEISAGGNGEALEGEGVPPVSSGVESPPAGLEAIRAAKALRR